MNSLSYQLYLISLLPNNWDLRGAKKLTLGLDIVKALLEPAKTTPRLFPSNRNAVKCEWVTGKKEMVIVISHNLLLDNKIEYTCSEDECEVTGECEISELNKLLQWIES